VEVAVVTSLFAERDVEVEHEGKGKEIRINRN